MMMKYKAFIIVGLKVTLGLVLLYFSMRGIAWDAIGKNVSRVNAGWLILSIGSVLICIGLKVLRWSYLLYSLNIKISRITIVKAFLMGQSANIILPARGGDIIRLGMSGSDKESLLPIALSIGLEKYLDLLALVIISFIFLPILISLDIKVGQFWIMVTGFVVGSLLVLILVFLPEIITIVQEKLKPDQGWKAKLLNWLGIFARGAIWFRSGNRKFYLILITGIIWLVMWVTNLLLFKALGLALNPQAAGLVLVLVYYGLLPALMPGNVGPFYFFALVALKPFSIPIDSATLYAILLHAIVTFPSLVLGGVSQLIARKGKSS